MSKETIHRPGSRGFTEALRKKRIKALEQIAENKDVIPDQRREAWDEAGRIKAYKE